jgi:hypothetical protein
METLYIIGLGALGGVAGTLLLICISNTYSNWKKARLLRVLGLERD